MKRSGKERNNHARVSQLQNSARGFLFVFRPCAGEYAIIRYANRASNNEKRKPSKCLPKMAAKGCYGVGDGVNKMSGLKSIWNKNTTTDNSFEDIELSFRALACGCRAGLGRAVLDRKVGKLETLCFSYKMKLGRWKEGGRKVLLSLYLNVCVAVQQMMIGSYSFLFFLDPLIPMTRD